MLKWRRAIQMIAKVYGIKLRKVRRKRRKGSKA